jgi:hypothetical protein
LMFLFAIMHISSLMMLLAIKHKLASSLNSISSSSSSSSSEEVALSSLSSQVDAFFYIFGQSYTSHNPVSCIYSKW